MTALFRYYSATSSKLYILVFTAIAGAICVIAPRYVWGIWDRWRIKVSEPSKAVLIIIRIIGIVILSLLIGWFIQGE